MKNKKALLDITTTILIVLLVLVIATIVILWYTVKGAIDSNTSDDSIVAEIVNLSAYENLTINHKALDKNGNEITGISYYGINGVYSTKKPIFTGTNRYSFWIYNETYFVEPNEFKEIDETTKNQTVILKAYKRENISDSIRIYGRGIMGEIEFEDEDLNEVANFELRYHSTKDSRFPFGSMIIFEQDVKIRGIYCGSAYEVMYPRYYSMEKATNRAFSFEISADDGEYTEMEFYCTVIKYKETELISRMIKITIIPKDLYLEKIDYTEIYELKLGYEDKYLNQITKPIYIGTKEIQ